MNRRTRLEWVILTINTVGLLGYLFWLVYRSERIFYTQDGVLYLLPCLPFFFIYVFLLHRKKPESP